MDDQKVIYRIEKIAGFTILSVALFIDLFQALLNLFAIGLIVNRIISFLAWLGFLTWFGFYGIRFTKFKTLGNSLIAFILEIIPILDLLPSWTVSAYLLIRTSRKEDEEKLKPKKTGLASKAGAAGANVLRGGTTAVSPSSRREGAERVEPIKPAAPPPAPVFPEEGRRSAAAAEPAKTRPANRPGNEIAAREDRAKTRGEEGKDIERQNEREVDREFGYTTPENPYDWAAPQSELPTNEELSGRPEDDPSFSYYYDLIEPKDSNKEKESLPEDDQDRMAA